MTTNSSGLYVAPNLPPGYYTLTVEAPGFKRSERTRNKLDAGIPYTVNFDLTVGAVSESVTVEASVATLQTETATVGKTVERAQIENMSLNGRNPLFLAQLKAGVRSGTALNGFSFGLTSGGFAINGGRSQDSAITFDGAVGIRTRANGTSVGTADLETVQEVQVLTANYSAEYGRSGNGQIRIVTKSGNRDFHGSLYEYFRNSALDANEWSRNRVGLPVAPFRFNQFGFIVSGPVLIPGKWNTDRSKLFWLFSQEYIRFRQEQTQSSTVPSMAMREGNFSELLGTNPFFNERKEIIDPTTGNPFPNNIIPANRLSPNGIAFLRTFPAPTPGFQQGTANFIQVRPNPQNQRKDTVAVDYNMTSNQLIRARFANYSWTAMDAFREGFDFAITDWSRPNQTGSINHIWTISPTMINEFLVSASVDRVYIGLDRTGNRYSRSARGINYPYLFPEPKEIDDKIPTIAINNFRTIDGGPYPAQSTGPIYNISNNFTKIWGNHQIKFGGLWERSGQNDFDQINVTGVPGGTNNQNGRFVFDDTRVGGTRLAVANAALGLFTTYAEIGPRSYTPYRSHMFEYFAQDSWRVNSRLKLEIGFRGTWMNGYNKSLWGNMAVFSPDLYDQSRAAVLDRETGNVISGDRYNGVFIPGESFPDAGRGRVPAIDSGLYDRLLRGSRYPSNSQHSIVPRLGLAYQASSRDVFRAGFGGFISRPGVYDSVFLGGNPPFQPMGSVANGIADQPGGATQVQFPQFFMTIDPVYKLPRGYNWNLSYQRNIGWETTVEVAYIGSTGNFLARERDLNQLQMGEMFRPENNPVGQRQTNANYLRPFKGFSNIPMLEHSGRSEYNAFQVEANRRFTRGVSYGFAYTYSTSYDHASGPRDRYYNAFDGSNMWGRSSFDTRHIAVANFIWEMPFFQNSSGFTKTALGGWQVTGVAQFQTGAPFLIGTNDDFYGIGTPDTRPWNLTTLSPENPKQFSAGGSGDSSFWFNPTANGAPIASRPANGTMGNQNRNGVTIHQPGFQNWNLALFKAFQFGERHTVQFRAESFNWLNHPNLGSANGGTTTAGQGVGTNPTAGDFGQVTAKGGQRQWQLMLRYSF